MFSGDIEVTNWLKMCLVNNFSIYLLIREIIAQLTEKIALNEKQIQEYVHMLEEREKDSRELQKKLQQATEMQADYKEQVSFCFIFNNQKYSHRKPIK